MSFASMSALRAALMNLAEKRFFMTYGIYVTKENFDVFEDGSRKSGGVSQGWYQDSCYNSMKSAKESLAKAKDALNEDFYDVTKINSVTLLGVRESEYGGENFSPLNKRKKLLIISRSDNSLMRINNTSPGAHLLWSLLVLIILIIINKCT